MDAQLAHRVQLERLHALIKDSMNKKEYEDVFPIFCDAQRAHDAYHSGPKPALGSVEYNLIEHLFSGITSLASSSLSHQVSSQRTISIDGCAGPHLLASETGASNVALALSLAQRSLAYPGNPDILRFFGHCCRALAYANMGDFMTELQTVIPEAEHASMLENVPQSWTDAPRCYKNAAQDAFYALHVSVVAGAGSTAHNLLDTMRALHQKMCGKIGHKADEHYAQMDRAGLARLQLPVLGLWEGDPSLAEFWGSHQMMLMALLRQRRNSGGFVTAALTGELSQRGISWVHDQSGQMFLNGATRTTHMSPTWVVPDNTRDGLRAAGLSGDTFEMARR